MVAFAEFCTWMARSAEGAETSDDSLRDTFEVFDCNGDGLISPSELKFVMETLGQDLSKTEVASMIHEMDTNGDGQIDYHEFQDGLAMTNFMSNRWRTVLDVMPSLLTSRAAV